MHRGLTMFEMLIALVLLTALTLGSAFWLGTVARASARFEELRIDPVIESVFTRIQEDVLVGDFDPSESRERNRPPRVRVVDGVLEIEGRHGTTHAYRLAREGLLRSSVVREERGPGSASARRLLSDLAAFTCEIDEEQQWLLVSIAVRATGARQQSGETTELRVQRRIRLP